jgi:hypothetical protein
MLMLLLLGTAHHSREELTPGRAVGTPVVQRLVVDGDRDEVADDIVADCEVFVGLGLWS